MVSLSNHANSACLCGHADRWLCGEIKSGLLTAEALRTPRGEFLIKTYSELRELRVSAVKRVRDHSPRRHRGRGGRRTQRLTPAKTPRAQRNLFQQERTEETEFSILSLASLPPVKTRIPSPVLAAFARDIPNFRCAFAASSREEEFEWTVPWLR
jgi:hypothetical protein